MRASLEPLPRAGSPRNIALLVAMFVGGIALSVHEYLESERSPRRAVHAATPAGEIYPQQTSSGCASRSLAPAPAPAQGEIAEEADAAPCWRPTLLEPTAASPSPSAFEPESG